MPGYERLGIMLRIPLVLAISTVAHRPFSNTGQTW